MQTMNTNKWSKEELNMLVNMYPNLGARIPDLNRSPRAIQTKANRLGLRSSGKKTPVVSEEVISLYYKLWPESKIARNGNGKEIYTDYGKRLIKHHSVLRSIVEEDVRNSIKLKVSMEELQNICIHEGLESTNIFEWELRLSRKSSDRVFLLCNNEVMSIIKTSRIEKTSSHSNLPSSHYDMRLNKLFDKTVALNEILNGIHVKTDKNLKAIVTINNQNISMRVGDKVRIRLFI